MPGDKDGHSMLQHKVGQHVLAKHHLVTLLFQGGARHPPLSPSVPGKLSSLGQPGYHGDGDERDTSEHGSGNHVGS